MGSAVFRCAAVLMAAACILQAAPPAAKAAETVRYFRSAQGSRHPLQLSGEISEETAKTIQNPAEYYAGYYDKRGRVTCMERYVNGRLFTRFKYGFSKKGKVVRIWVTTADGMTVQLKPF